MNTYVSGFLFDKNNIFQKGDHANGNKNAKNRSISRHRGR